MESLKNADNNDEFEVVEFDEILLSDLDDDDNDTKKPKPKPSQPIPNLSQPKIPSKRGRKPKTENTAKKAPPTPPKNTTENPPCLKYTRKPTRPVRLFSFTDSDIIHKFSLNDPDSKNLAVKLLNIVKAVNSRRQLKVEKNGAVVPNFYIMATYREPDNENRKISAMTSTDIVNLVKDVVHMIKIGVYRKVNDIDIICDSPAIFLIKYVSVKNWNSNMNAVYVVTSEYLLPYLCKIRAAEEQEENAKKRIHVSLTSRATSKHGATAVGPKRKGKKMEVSDEVKKARSEEPSQQVQIKEEDNVEENEVNSVDEPVNDEDIVQQVLSKYLEPEAVLFFLTQMKVSGRNFSRYRWSDEDKLFALNLLRNNATEYSVLYQKYMLPSDKTLEKFMKRLQNDQIDNIRIDEDDELI